MLVNNGSKYFCDDESYQFGTIPVPKIRSCDNSFWYQIGLRQDSLDHLQYIIPTEDIITFGLDAADCYVCDSYMKFYFQLLILASAIVNG